MDKKYQVVANKEVVAVVETLRGARILARKMAREINAKRVSKDLWSTGSMAVMVRRLYE